MPSAGRDAAPVILVVEDEWEILDIVRDILEADGFVVRTAAHGRAALATLEREPHVDLVLTDLMMPLMDGFELVRTMSRHDSFSKIPVVVMTAAAPEAIGLRDLNVSRVLRKPLRVETLLDEVRRATSPSAS